MRGGSKRDNRHARAELDFSGAIERKERVIIIYGIGIETRTSVVTWELLEFSRHGNAKLVVRCRAFSRELPPSRDFYRRIPKVSSGQCIALLQWVKLIRICSHSYRGSVETQQPLVDGRTHYRLIAYRTTLNFSRKIAT